MALFADCMACQEGRHEMHVDVPQAVPEGVLGGQVCRCRGECRDRTVSCQTFDCSKPALPSGYCPNCERIIAKWVARGS